MPFLQLLLMMLTIFGTANASLEMSADTTFSEKDLGKRKAEDAIPVIEIRGEGKPMSSAQIRHLEELSNGGPLDLKTETVWKSATCERKVQRNDYVTFHYKCFTEDGKKIAQSYGGETVKMQVGVGMASRGLDKGLLGMCVEELRKITIPYRLSRKGKSVVWKNLPNDEHWITMQIELLSLTPYTHQEQFRFLDSDNDTKIAEDDLINWSKGMKKNYGKTWKNDQIDTVLAAKYYIKYFDVNRDGFVDLGEFEEIMERDEKMMKREKVKAKGRRRDPGFAWILDFNNDGVVTFEENDEAPNHFEKDPTTLPYQIDKEEL
ncbi:unnamed protein product, partial [Mesorhabditis belari]|uniref:peptidylprolyl isomerase n=1 Tax=Mesorhabditis belari TaxID=2138241 RepID=A0AAF3F4L5_9BILA